MARAAEVPRRTPRLAPIPRVAKPRRAALLDGVMVADLRICQESDPRETDARWSLAEAERVALGCAGHLLGVASPAAPQLLCYLGDHLDFGGAALSLP
ncbi:hypothetical protein [Rubrimonas cliftonensis]|uniref:Uncharacterized protein n=1 Tax=Rubrimonas cliftonensis TaxID=89524 RepID=A0A1H4EJP5_9RHOB|nr:hypothetical protein [Rubrimonas cliftonensis]SEA85166.1 hypothetical protein SAMN05444370_11453 [Rubrimonas cliftonensis]